MALPAPKGWEYVRVGPSGVHGRGLFAARRMPKGAYVMEYRGEKVPKAEGVRRTDEQWSQGRMYMFDLNRRWDIDGSPDWNLARLANYSCDPNCESQNDRGRRIWIVAARPIRQGEELTYDYNFSFVDPPPVCHCGSRKCRGFIVGKADLPKLRRWLASSGWPIPVGAQPRKRAVRQKSVAAATRKPGGKKRVARERKGSSKPRSARPRRPSKRGPATRKRPA